MHVYTYTCAYMYVFIQTYIYIFLLITYQSTLRVCGQPSNIKFKVYFNFLPHTHSTKWLNLIRAGSSCWQQLPVYMCVNCSFSIFILRTAKNEDTHTHTFSVAIVLFVAVNLNPNQFFLLVYRCYWRRPFAQSERPKKCTCFTHTEGRRHTHTQTHTYIDSHMNFYLAWLAFKCNICVYVKQPINAVAIIVVVVVVAIQL